MNSIPGWALDLLTDGVRGNDEQSLRQQITRAMRRVMMAAQRSDWDYARTAEALNDQSRYRLAKQIATGRSGSQISTRQRNQFIAKHWAETYAVTSSRPAWDRIRAIDAIQFVRDNWEQTANLPNQQRLVLAAALEIADSHGTTRPALPIRVIADKTGIPRSTVGDVLARMSDDGEWLRKVQSGNYKTRRASLYLLAPSLLQTLTPYGGASPPKSDTPPKSDPPKSEISGADMDQTISLVAANPQALAQAIRLLASIDPAAAGQVIADAQTDVRHLRVVDESA